MLQHKGNRKCSSPKWAFKCGHVVYLISVEVEEVPVVRLPAGLHAVGGDVVLVHVVSGLGHVEELLHLVHVDAAVGVVAEAEHLEQALVLARHVLRCGEEISLENKLER